MKRLHVPYHGRTYTCAHRGGSMETMENTLHAFKRSEKLGIDIIETDVQESKDGVVVVAHDYDFKRLCGDERKVKDVDYAEFPKIQEEVWSHFDIKRPFKRGKKDDDHFCTLEDVYKTLNRETFLHIELKKNHSKEFIDKVVELTKKYDREEYTVLGCVPEEDNKYLQSVHNGPTFASRPLATKILLLYLVGLLPFYPIKNSDFYSVPHATWT